MTIGFQNITHAYGNNTVLDSLTVEAKAGEITCLFGSSGSGKSTLLRLAAGIEHLQQGVITLNGEELATPGKQPPPEKRPIGLMFQENALFPHMSIADNIAFGLHGLLPRDKKRIIAEWLETVGLPDFGPRYPHTLSGGQLQRVALARSLAPKPQALLMDEPYASIDNVLRRRLRESARTVLKQTESTVIFVTHDPIEALEMADVIAVLDKGLIIQCAKPQTLYENPSEKSVACLFGDAEQVEATTTTHGYETIYGLIRANIASGFENRQCELVIRPNGLHIAKAEDSTLRVYDIRFVGNRWILHLLPDDAPKGLQPLRVASSELDGLDIGEKVIVEALDTEFFAFYA